jgi:mRNA interferase RelE/StbE
MQGRRAAARRRNVAIISLDIDTPHCDIIAMKTTGLTHRAARELDALPEEDRFAITEALTLYAIEERGHVKRLAGREGYRLRVRDCRVIFDDDGVTVLAIHIGRRTTTTCARTLR